MVTEVQNISEIFTKKSDAIRAESIILESLQAAGIFEKINGCTIRAEKVGSSKIRPIDAIKRVPPRGGCNKFLFEIPRVSNKIPAIVCSIVGEITFEELEKIFLHKEVEAPRTQETTLAKSLRIAREFPELRFEKIRTLQQPTQSEEKMTDQNGNQEKLSISDFDEERVLFLLALQEHKDNLISATELKTILTELGVLTGTDSKTEKARYRAVIRYWINEGEIAKKHPEKITGEYWYLLDAARISEEVSKHLESESPSPSENPEHSEKFSVQTEEISEKISENSLENSENSLENSEKISENEMESLPQGEGRDDLEEISEESGKEEVQSNEIFDLLKKVSELVEREKTFAENGKVSQIKNRISAISRQIDELEAEKKFLELEYNSLPEPLSREEELQLENLRRILGTSE